MGRWWMIVLLGLTFALTAWVSRTVFERLPHLEDELAYVHQAELFARGDVVQPSPAPRPAFWKPFVVDFQGRRFSKYSPGWSFWLAFGVMAGQRWVVNGWFAVLTVALVYRLGAESFNADVGRLAAWLVAFSPMALLLNASLMGHTSALFMTMAFLYAMRRLLHDDRRAMRWGLVAGMALGALTANRTLTAVAVALPFVVFHALRLLGLLIRRRDAFWPALRPLLLLSVVMLLLSAVVPAYRWAVTGSPSLNPYELVWSYDKVGFCETCGRSGHTLRKGLRHAANDLTLTAADLFGWQLLPLNAAQKHHLLYESTAYPGRGWSWLLLPFGLLIGVAARDTRADTLQLATVPLSIVVVYMAYWVGSQRYSTRYYFEALGAVALLSAIPLGYWARRWRVPVYTALIALTLYTGIVYTWPRLRLLHGFNGVSRATLAQIDAHRTTDKPALVIITQAGRSMTWRANGSLMAVTGAYLDTPFVLARDRADRSRRAAIVAQFPDYEIIDLYGAGSKWWFAPPQP